MSGPSRPTAAAASGAAVIGAGLHPFTPWQELALSEGERYERLVDTIAWPARRLTTHGVHVHVGVRSGDKAIATVNALSGYLPIFLALSAASPFWNGEDTGLASTRTKIFEAIEMLRDGTAELLVATDVAARGLDVDTLTHVVNYDVPSAAESYVHRIGRVGRAGREGVAITLAEPRERRGLENIERLTKQKFEIATVPTVSDLRIRQIEMTVNAVREALTAVDLEDFNTVLHALEGEDSDRNIALAAIKLVHESRGATIDELEIPDASDRLRGKSSDGKKKFDKKAPRNASE